jgi:hypothetical protein
MTLLIGIQQVCTCHALAAIRGGQETFSTHKPILVMELAPYVHEGHSERFDETLRVLWSLGYQLSDVATGRPMPRDPAEVRRLIPLHASINAIGMPA